MALAKLDIENITLVSGWLHPLVRPQHFHQRVLRLSPGPRSFHFRLGLPFCFRFGGRFLFRFWLHAFRKLRRSCLAIPFLESLIGYFAFEQKLGEFSTLRLAFKRHDILSV